MDLSSSTNNAIPRDVPSYIADHKMDCVTIRSGFKSVSVWSTWSIHCIFVVQLGPQSSIHRDFSGESDVVRCPFLRSLRFILPTLVPHFFSLTVVAVSTAVLSAPLPVPEYLCLNILSRADIATWMHQEGRRVGVWDEKKSGCSRSSLIIRRVSLTEWTSTVLTWKWQVKLQSIYFSGRRP